MRPNMFRKFCSDPQPDAHYHEQHNIYEVPAQNVIRHGKREKRIRSSWPKRALSRGHGLREAIQRA